MRALTCALCLTTPALATEVEIVVDRSEQGIELFLSLPAADATDVLGADLSELDGLTTGVDFSVLQNGTWTQGDVLWGGVDTAVNGTAVTFEAMSMMVHPANQALPTRRAVLHSSPPRPGPAGSHWTRPNGSRPARNWLRYGNVSMPFGPAPRG